MLLCADALGAILWSFPVGAALAGSVVASLRGFPLRHGTLLGVCTAAVTLVAFVALLVAAVLGGYALSSLA